MNERNPSLEEVPAARAVLLARYAALPLAEGRAEVAGALLASWLPGIDELCRKMSAPAHQALIPITGFVHAPDGTEDGA